MKGIVDHFEGEFVVIEIDGVTKDFPRELVMDNVDAGDVVIFKQSQWRKDECATEARSKHIKALMDSVWED